MTCLIDSVIVYLTKQGKNAKAIRRHIRERYRISIDTEAIKERLKRIHSTPEIS